MKTATVEDFPDHILQLIFSFLSPYADFDSCMRVCKRWHQMVKSSRRKLEFRFRQLHDLEWILNDPPHPPESRNISDRFAHAACYHESGSIFVFGGMTSAFGFLNDIWKFDLTTRTWKRLPGNGDLPRPKASSSLIAYNDTLILFGGWCPSQWRACHPGNVFCGNLHYYCIPTGVWTAIPSRDIDTEPLANHSASLIGDWMISFGGLTPSGCTDKIRVFDIRRRVWFFPATTSMKPLPRCLHSQVVLDDKHLVIAGGECAGRNSLPDVWLLTIGSESDTWQWEQLEVLNNDPSPPLLWSRQACKIGDKAIFLSCPNVQGLVPRFRTTQSALRIPRNGRERNDSLANNGSHEESLPNVLLSVMKRNANRQAVRTSRMHKWADSSRKQEANWQLRVRCTCPLNVYALHLDRAISQRIVTWSIVPTSSQAPQDTFMGSVIKGRGELVLFGGVRHTPDTVSPSLRFFFEQTHGEAVGSVFILKPSPVKSAKLSLTF